MYLNYAGASVQSAAVAIFIDVGIKCRCIYFQKLKFQRIGTFVDSAYCKSAVSVWWYNFLKLAIFQKF